MEQPPRLTHPADLAGEVLIDVRDPAEYAAGHMPGAVSIPLVDLAAAAPRLAGRPVVVMCGGRDRAITGAVILLEAGLTDVTVLDGGTNAWAQWSGLTLETG